MFTQDFVINKGGQLTGSGELGSRIFPTGGERVDIGMWRPFIDHETRQTCVLVNSGQDKYNPVTQDYEPQLVTVPVHELREQGIELPVHNATALEYRQWAMLDKLVIPIARQKLRAWSDLAAASPYSVDGWSKSILEHQSTNDPGLAFQDMDGLTEGQNARRKYQLEGIPLPITHTSFSYNKRELMQGRAQGTPINVRDAEAALRRLMEKVESVLIGTATGMTYGDTTNYTSAISGKIYGYTTYPNRATVTLTTPLGTNPQATVDDVLEMRDALYDNGFEGPYVLYTSRNWDRYLDQDYAFTNGTNYAVNPTRTLRSRIKDIEQIQDVRRLSYFTGSAFQMVLVQMTSEVAQAVNGMDINAIQWETVGGLQVNFKWMCIYAPRLFSDLNGQCGIAHGSN